MPIEVSCPGCGTKLKIPENMIGKKAKCKKCATPFQLVGLALVVNSAGESQMLSTVSMPAIPQSNEDESVPMASAVEERDISPSLTPAPLVRSSSATAQNNASFPSADLFDFTPVPTKSPLPAAAAKPPAPSPHTAPVVANPPAASTGVDQATPPPSPALILPPVRPGAVSAPRKSLPVSPPSVSPPAEEGEADPFATPFSQAPAETVAEEDPFSFISDRSPPAQAKRKKQDLDEEAEEKAKTKSKQKTKPREDAPAEMSPAVESSPEPTDAGDPFSFTADPTSSSREEPQTKRNKKRKTDEEDEEDANVKSKKVSEVDSEKQASRRYVRRGEKKSSKLLLIAGILCLLAFGAGIAATIVFMKKEPEQAKKTTEKTEEPAPTPPPDPPKEDAKTASAKKDDANAKPAKKDIAKRNFAPKEAGDFLPKAPKMGANAAPVSVAMLALPANLKKYEFRAPQAKELVQRPSSDAPIDVEVAIEKVRRFFPCPNRVNNDAVVVWQSNPGFNGRGERLSVDTYSGTTGGKTGRFEYDGDGKDAKCDVSTDGKVFAAAVDGTVTVWNLADRTKALEGFDPYADKPIHKKAGLAAIYIPSNSKKLLTVSTAGAMHLFEIDTKKQIGEYIPENSTPGRVVQGKNVAAEESRSSVVVAIGGFIHQVSTLDLKLSWKLELRGEAGRSFGLSVAGTPGRIAYAFETDADNKKERVILFCQPNGEPTLFRWQDSAGEPVSVNWSGTECAIVGTTRGVVWFQYDSEGKIFTPLAMAEVPNNKGLHETTERAHWYLIANPKDPAKSLMLELSIPIANLLNYLNLAAAKQPLDTLRLDSKGLWK